MSEKIVNGYRHIQLGPQCFAQIPPGFTGETVPAGLARRATKAGMMRTIRKFQIVGLLLFLLWPGVVGAEEKIITKFALKDNSGNIIMLCNDEAQCDLNSEILKVIACYARMQEAIMQLHDVVQHAPWIMSSHGDEKTVTVYKSQVERLGTTMRDCVRAGQ